MGMIVWRIKGKFQEFFYNRAMDIFSIRQSVVVNYYTSHRVSIYQYVRKTIKERKARIFINEGYQLATAVIATRKVKGDLAEVGVYRGGSAKIIAHYKEKKKKLHLFDTWEGLPEPTKKDSDVLYQGMFETPFDEVRDYFANEKNVYFHKGVFPIETWRVVKNSRFSFVNLDVDLYSSTFDCLNFFYPRLNKGGILISHDYSGLPGVYRAFNKFFKNKPESIIELSGSQCLIVKL